MEELRKLIKVQIIVQLTLAGVSQSAIRQIVGGDIMEVNRIAKAIGKGKREK